VRSGTELPGQLRPSSSGSMIGDHSAAFSFSTCSWAFAPPIRRSTEKIDIPVNLQALTNHLRQSTRLNYCN